MSRVAGGSGGSVAETGERRADEARGVSLCLEDLDREELERFGRILDHRPASLRGRTVGMALAEMLLLVRTREGSRLLCGRIRRSGPSSGGGVSGTSC